MNEKMFYKTRLYVTAIVTIAIWTLLAWNYYHGGVPSHHILAKKDLPSISNWWGGLLLPLLTWWLLYRIQKRVVRNNPEYSDSQQTQVIYGFVGALFYGIVLSVFFKFGYSDIPGYMLLGIFVLALFFPIYRSEYLLGFVIGMTYTFGAVLPTLIGSILASIAAVLHLLIRPRIMYVASRAMRLISSKA